MPVAFNPCCCGMRTATLTLFLAAGALANWERHVSMEKGAWTDFPSPHSLEYFTANSCVARAPNAREGTCFKARAELKGIGLIGKFGIYDLNYFFDTPTNRPEPSTRNRSSSGLRLRRFERSTTKVKAKWMTSCYKPKF